jgi:4-amino-4-deoxy-L-arabinose transferase-like glycosyltransferase
MRYTILCILVLCVFAFNIVWVNLDTVPPAWDFSRHLYISYLYWQAFDWDSQSLWFDILSVEPFYPPLYHLSLLPFAIFFGFTPFSAVLLNSICLGVIIFSTYGIGSLINSRRAGLLAAFLVACYPFLSYISRRPLIDTMLTAAVVFGYYLFLKSNHFESRLYSLMFAIIFACGMMLKWTFLIYIFPAVIIGLVGGDSFNIKRALTQFTYFFGMILALFILPLSIYLLEEWKWVALFLEFSVVVILVRTMPFSTISSTKIINLVTLAVVSLVICFPWYSHVLINLIPGAIKSNLSGIREGDPTSGFERWIDYTYILQDSVGGILFVLFLIGFLFTLAQRKNFNFLVIGWIAFSYLVFSKFTNHDMRYIMPVLPGIAVISSSFICGIKRNIFRRVVIGLTFVIGLITYSNSFLSKQIDIKVFGKPAFGPHYPPITDQNWPTATVLNDIINEATPIEGEKVTVRTLTNYPYFNRGVFRNHALFNDLPVVMKSVKRNVGEFTDFFITKEGAGSGPAFYQKDINPKKRKLLEDPALRRTFPLFKKYLLPDGTNGLVFKKDVSAATDIEGVDNLNELKKRFLRALAEYPIYGIKDGKNLTISIIPTQNPEDLYLGRYKSIRIKADSVVTNSIRLYDFELNFEGIQINLYDLFLNGKLILFELDRILPRGIIRFEDLEDLAAKEMNGRVKARLMGQENQLILKASYLLPQGIDIKGKAVARVDFKPGEFLNVDLESLNLGPVSIPKAFSRRKLKVRVDLKPTKGWPLYTDIGSLKIFSRRLEIN